MRKVGFQNRFGLEQGIITTLEHRFAITEIIIFPASKKGTKVKVVAEIQTTDDTFKYYLEELLKEMQDHEEIDSFEVKEEEG